MTASTSIVKLEVETKLHQKMEASLSGVSKLRGLLTTMDRSRSLKSMKLTGESEREPDIILSTSSSCCIISSSLDGGHFTRRGSALGECLDLLHTMYVVWRPSKFSKASTSSMLEELERTRARYC